MRSKSIYKTFKFVIKCKNNNVVQGYKKTYAIVYYESYVKCQFGINTELRKDIKSDNSYAKNIPCGSAITSYEVSMQNLAE